jgi:Putative MetA-pathway of phenol degradation
MLSPMRLRHLCVIGFGLCAAYVAPSLRAQQLEPRAYSAAPVGTEFLLVSFARSTGDVLVDPSLPVVNTQAGINTLFTGYSHTFALAGHTASVAVVLPYTEAKITALVAGVPEEAHRSGLADSNFRFAWNLFGDPAASPAEFVKRPSMTTLGFSLTVVAPTGQYDPSRLINISSNRWAFKPEMGVSWPLGPWFLEAMVGVWVYTANNDYYGDTTRTQDPLFSVQIHGGYTFRPGLWLAFDATHYRGGGTSVDDGPSTARQSNSRYGTTLSVPLSRAFSMKFAVSNGYAVRAGGDFKTGAITLQYRWFD